MSKTTNALSEYVRKTQPNLKRMSRVTGIPYSSLYDSLCNEKRDRELRADEFFKICSFLDRNPMEFAKDLVKDGGE